MKHLYISTYCQHAKHDQCRHFCKICRALCLCPCHATFAALAHPPSKIAERVKKGEA